MAKQKILAIQASPRKRNTKALVAEVCEFLQNRDNNLEIEIVQLTDFEQYTCTGCQRCINGKACPLNDSVEELKQRIVASDALIISTPVYMAGVPGSLKTFIDRTADWFHRPELIGKPMLILVSTAGSYAARTARYLNLIGMHWGCAVAGAWTRNARQKHGEKEIARSSAVRRFTRLILQGSQTYRPGWQNIYLFTLQKILAKNILPLDEKFREKRGWFRSGFFFPAVIGPLKRLTFHLLYELLRRVIKRPE